MAKIEHLLEFESLTNFPIIKLLNDIKIFFVSDYPEIVKFYQGNITKIKKERFENLKRLTLETEKCLDKFSENKKIFNKSYYWEILDSLDDIKIKLYTTSNLSKFLRSSILKGSIKSGYLISVILDDGQTLEDVSNFILKDSDSDNDWVDIAITNDLKEQDYDIEGGKDLLVRKRIFQSDLVTSFIDNTVGNKIYGRDFSNKTEFVDDDLKVLSEKDTLVQSVETLSQVCVGDIPEFRTIGFNSKLYKGVNYSQLNFPSIAKDLIRNYTTDDLFKEVTILEIKHIQGDVYIKFSVGTKIGDVQIQSTTI